MVAGLHQEEPHPMAEIINLRQARKRKERAAKEAKAEANRVAFGRTKGERQQTDAERDLARRRLDGHRRDDGEPE
jgi:hypothetical protein